MKIGILVSRMDISGGTERMVSVLANHWVKENKDVVIITFFNEISFYKFDKQVRIHCLNVKKYDKSNFVTKLKWYKEAYDKLVNYLKNEPVECLLGIMAQMSFCAAFAGKRLHIPVIACEHTQYYGYNKPIIYARKYIYKLVSGINVLTDEDNKLFRDNCNKKVITIPNPLTLGKCGNIDYKKKTVLAVGRIAYSKGFDLLLQAWENTTHMGWQLIIIGQIEENDYYEKLIRYVKDHKLEGSVLFKKPQINIEDVYSEASILVVSSRYEGFSLALSEGMAAGLSAISFDCPFGPRTIITNNVNGILVPPENVKIMSEKLSCLMENKDVREALGKKAIIDIHEKYDWNIIKEKWEHLFKSVCGDSYYE